ncbi:MAG: DUF6672 family protein [Rectinema sp.]|uniref:Uncharacterized protein n=1 Tax=uncultured spirochete TaxID=156406 RepID=A0A3P3XRP3_9SPIR|nr:exported hypothetical protein [uncultured spirochete]
MNVKLRRNLLRVALCLIAVAGGFLLSLVGMYHSIILDNSEFSSAGAVLPPLEGLRVLSEAEPVEMSPDDRILVSTKGPSTTLVFEITSPETQQSREISYTLHMGFKKQFFLSVPAIVGGEKNPFLVE